MFSIPAGKKLVVTIQLLDDPQVPTVSPPPGPGTDPPPPPPVTSYDMNTHAMLRESFVGLNLLGAPAESSLQPLGQPATWQTPVNGMERQNSSYRWSGALVPPVSGEYTFFLRCKSGGSLVLDGEVLWGVDREQDATSSSAPLEFTFTATLEAGRAYAFTGSMVYQGFLAMYELTWRRPDRDAAEPISSLFCRPPIDWPTRIKAYIPPEPPPSPFAEIDWETYQSPVIPLTFFPASSPWNTPIDQQAVDPLSFGIIAALGSAWLHPVFGQHGNGIPYEMVPPGTAKTQLTFQYAAESDPGPYPLTAKPIVEGGGGDKHWLGVSYDEQMLYELFLLVKSGDRWEAGSGAIYPTTVAHDRPLGWTSADAAGLPILPGLVRYEEVEAGEINHALRISVGKTRRAFVHPARHWASSELGEQYAPMGARLRLKASVDVSGAPAQVRPILVALQRFGAFVADNGSPSFIGLCGAPDSRWVDTDLAWMKRLVASDFEVVTMGEIITEVP